jgi:hypothetical protein
MVATAGGLDVHLKRHTGHPHRDGKVLHDCAGAHDRVLYSARDALLRDPRDHLPRVGDLLAVAASRRPHQIDHHLVGSGADHDVHRVARRGLELGAVAVDLGLGEFVRHQDSPCLEC